MRRRDFLATSAATAAWGSLATWGQAALQNLATTDQAETAQSTTGEVAWLAEVQQAPANVPAPKRPLLPLLTDEQGRKITTRAGWEQHAATLRSQWGKYLGLITHPYRKPELEVLEEDRTDGVIRQLVRYETEPGLPVEGYLLRPEKLTGKTAGVVVLHATADYTIRQPAGLEGMPEKFYGLMLAKRGLVTFCPRCYLWDSQGVKITSPHGKALLQAHVDRHPNSTGMAKMLWDAQRGLDVLASLPEVDAERLGAIGHSLGAKEVLYLAAFDERVKATASSEGGISIDFSNWEAPWYLGPEAHQSWGTRDHHELLALIAPRAFLLLGGDMSLIGGPEGADGPKSWPYIAAAMEVYKLYGETVRLGLYCHDQGHASPPVAVDRMLDWLTTYLGSR